MRRLSLDDLARVAAGIESLSASDLVVSHYPDGEWSLGSPDNEWVTRKELQALSVELLERRAQDAHRELQVAGVEPEIPAAGIDLEKVETIMFEALAKAKERT